MEGTAHLLQEKELAEAAVEAEKCQDLKPDSSSQKWSKIFTKHCEVKCFRMFSFDVQKISVI